MCINNSMQYLISNLIQPNAKKNNLLKTNAKFTLM